MVILAILIIAALIFGIGGLLEGLFWLTLIGIALLIAAGVALSRVLRPRA